MLLLGHRRVGVGYHNRLEVRHHRIPRGGLAANVGYGPGDQHRIEASRAQPVRQLRRPRQKRAEAVFADDLVLRANIEIRPKIVPLTALTHRFDAAPASIWRQHAIHMTPLDRGTFVDRILDPEHTAARRAHRRREPVHLRNDVASSRTHRMTNGIVHEGILQIDHHERRARGIETGMRVLDTATPHDSRRHRSGNVQSIHRDLHRVAARSIQLTAIENVLAEKRKARGFPCYLLRL